MDQEAGVPPGENTLHDLLELRPRMELVVDPAQPFTADVGVDLGRRDLAVPEHQLDGPEVGPALKEVRLSLIHI